MSVFLYWLLVVSLLGEGHSQTQDFQNRVENYIDDNLEFASRVRKSLVSIFKANTVVEPTPKETDEADKALSLSFGIFSGFFPDNNETMDTFCDERKERREIYRVYVRRKYTFNAVFRIGFALTAKHLERLNDNYCDSQRTEFLTHANHIRDYDTQLHDIRGKFKKSLVKIQSTNLGFRKTYTLCCSFWKFQSDTLNAIKSEESRQFFEQMFAHYNRSMTQWPHICAFYRMANCLSYHYSDGTDDNQYSIAFNWIRASAKVCSLLF